MQFKGERLRALREAMGWSMIKTEEATGVKQSTISELENGVIRFPRSATVDKLCSGFMVKDRNYFYLDEVSLPVEVLPADTPEELLQFMLSGENVPWIRLAKSIKDSGLSTEDIDQIVRIISRNKK